MNYNNYENKMQRVFIEMIHIICHFCVYIKFFKRYDDVRYDDN